MKKFLFWLVMFFCFSAAAYKCFFWLDHKSEIREQTKNSSITRLSNEEISLIQEGDFILRRGFGFFSDYVSEHLNDGDIDVTHAGIIIKENGDLFVIHSLSSDVSDFDGIQKQPLQDFLLYCAPEKIIVTRTKHADTACGGKIAERAKYYLSQKIPFDHNGKFDDDNELYCTELIWKILEKDLKVASPPTLAEEREKFFYSMMPMYSTDYFDIIINQYSN
ncbi:YiiX/YebB-like N1pC/P60 family cysteine hydrolase [Flavobacterium sp.]|uniref:YiiX/YebB-like N1pC/P60 family cysteine hydrolase n=1 Tax=Flavobacterium sp. TaxID=239 RepID=UPI00261A9842|nr:YiiX/YebB-like N1pC/P60 family cysteine hydrolase [Flavobacterium sp.]